MHTTLISPAALAAHLDTPGWVILDCRHDLANPQAGQAQFEAGHIPGAQFADLDRDLSGTKTFNAQGVCTSGRHPLPDPQVFIDTLRRWGVRDNTQVIAYDGQGGMFAARLWWMLRWVGHGAVAVLDGGMPAWQAAGYPVDTSVRSLAAGDIKLHAPLVHSVSTEDVLANVTVARRTVIDARSPDRFRGENETLDPVGGHIPGAKNRFFKDNLQADGRFKPASQLQSEFKALIDAPQDAIMQCGSGVTACHNLLAMEVAGLAGAALYPGSWSQWCSNPARPVATGA